MSPRIPKPRLDLLGLAVLGIVAEQPRHPYEIARLLRERGKDSDVDSPRALYHAVARLERQGLIEASETQREGRRPERTLYRATEAGMEEAGDWIRELLTIPHDQRTFYAALSHLGGVTPDDVVSALQRRVVLLEAGIAASDALERSLLEAGRLPRIFLIEGEYLRDQHRAEVAWVRAAIAEIKDKRLEWPAWLLDAHKHLRKAAPDRHPHPFGERSSTQASDQHEET